MAGRWGAVNTSWSLPTWLLTWLLTGLLRRLLTGLRLLVLLLLLRGPACDDTDVLKGAGAVCTGEQWPLLGICGHNTRTRVNRLSRTAYP